MLITNSAELKRFYAENRKWQGIPSLEVTTGGRVFVCFYSGGSSEMMGNYVVLVKSDDGGANFSDAIAVAYVGESARAFDGCLWIDPLGRLWFAWAVMPGGRVEYVLCEDPDAESLSFSEIRTILGEVMINKPIVLSDGRWLFPSAIWSDDFFSNFRHKVGKETGALAVVSEDMGKTFRIIGKVEAENRSCDEHCFLEKWDGSIEIYIRTLYGIALSRSTDGGITWSEDEDSRLGGPCSRFCIRRLSSGNILLVNHYKFHGRNNLTAMISRDDGKTFEGFLRIDSRPEVSYPDAAEHDGKIYIVHDRERGANYDPQRDYSDSAREILLSVVTEQEILDGRISKSDSYLCSIVSKLYDHAERNSEKE